MSLAIATGSSAYESRRLSGYGATELHMLKSRCCDRGLAVADLNGSFSLLSKKKRSRREDLQFAAAVVSDLCESLAYLTQRRLHRVHPVAAACRVHLLVQLLRGERIMQHRHARLSPRTALERQRNFLIDATLQQLVGCRAVSTREQLAKLASMASLLSVKTRHFMGEHQVDTLVHRACHLRGERSALLLARPRQASEIDEEVVALSHVSLVCAHAEGLSPRSGELR
mmetsp:Transcript_83334/g.166362  ORF Transcript_83334/g.166362 Transcript_83334/m.166362 type:complete len:227 (+) Transcript_83334:975-1655(+)